MIDQLWTIMLPSDTAAQHYVEALRAKSEVVGIILFGSWARGNNRPDSDIDLLVILREGFKRTVEQHAGRTFEVTYTTEQGAAEYWASSPDDAVELWSVANVLFDRDGTVERLREVGRAIRERGKRAFTPEEYAHVYFDAHDQLRAVDELAHTDSPTAHLLLSALVLRLGELFFDLRQLWTPPPKQRLARLQEADQQAHELLVSYYSAPSLDARLVAAKAFCRVVFR
jgi:predicted nucleotidyltransferase